MTDPAAIAASKRRQQILGFLNGQNALDGQWFGERNEGQRYFWWRKYLPELADERLSDAQRDIMIRLVLSVIGTKPQRDAFVDGYNDKAMPPHASAEMRRRHAFGNRVRTIIQEQSK